MNTRKDIFAFFTANNFRISRALIFICLSVYLLVSVLFFVEPNLGGDVFEYLLMTESFHNHFSPDLRAEDLNSFKEYLIKFKAWNDYTIGPYNNLIDLLNSNEFLKNTYGYYVDLNGEKYSYHFWLYSLLNLPARYLLSWLNLNPIGIFQVTNAIIVIAFSFYILFFSSLTLNKRLLLLFFFLFSSVFWYIPFFGPEVFSATFTFLAFVLYYEKRMYWAILCSSLASLHYPPIAFITIFLIAKVLLDRGFLNFKNLLLITLSAFVTLIPYIFYYLNYRIPNLIVHQGFIKEDYLSSERYWGFFFDLNQGMILGIPVIVFIFIFIYFKKIFKKSWDYDLLLLPVLLLIVYTFINMKIWVGGYLVQRYSTWCAMPIIAFSVMHLNDTKRIIRIFLIIALIFQGLNIFNCFNNYPGGGLNVRPYQFVQPTRLAKWVEDKFPSLYNPDPEIFITKTLGYFPYDMNSSPVIYYNKEGKARKIAVHILKVNDLPENLREKCRNIKFINGWGYINLCDD